MFRTATVTVTYNPEREMLLQSLEVICKMTDLVIVVDNSDKNPLSQNELPGVVLIPMKGNLGIASALNEGFRKAEELGADWVLSFDQDSIPPKDMLEQYCKFIETHPDAGQIGPSYLLENTTVNSCSVKDNSKENTISNSAGINTDNTKHTNAHKVEHLITSGAMTSMQAYHDVGGFKDELFIDLVDVDFSLRLADKGYELWQLDGVNMLHRLGDARKGLMLKGKLRFVYVEHSPVRWYYMVRNALYINEWHHERHGKFCRKYLRKRIWKNVLKMLLFGEQKALKRVMVLKGIRDWRHKVTGPVEAGK